MRAPCQFKINDVMRAAKAVRAAGMEIARVEIAKDGTIAVIPSKAQAGQVKRSFESAAPEEGRTRTT